MWNAATTSKTITKTVKTAINNWNQVRTLVEYGATFSSNPSTSIVGVGSYSNEYRIVLTKQTYCIVAPTHSTGSGTWDANVTIKGTAYNSASASGIGTAKGSFTASISNWQGGSKTISFGKTFKSPPSVNWYSPNPSSSALASDWTINITNITTTGCTIRWGAQTGSASHELGWIAEGNI